MQVQQVFGNGELIGDLFAGGGGASLGLEWGLGRPADFAVNHSADAISMHRRNHPATAHYEADVWDVDLRRVTGGRAVGLLWASPDCTHFSKAKGGKPRSQEIRSLAWAVAKHVEAVRPRVLMLENVEEFADWGPLLADGRPDPAGKGMTFRQWVGHLEALGYRVEWCQLRACDYGAPTIRKRLFLVARRDGLPIAWPEASHGPKSGGGPAWRTAAACILWHLPCPSIFERKRTLADNTCRRIARGLVRYVVEAKEPFIVRMGHYSNITGAGDHFRGQSLRDPLSTVTAGGNDKALVVPYVIGAGGPAYAGEPRGLDAPAGTIIGKNNTALVAAFLERFNRQVAGSRGQSPAQPFNTVVANEDFNGLVASHLVKLRGTCKDGQALDQPMPTVTAGGQHLAEVRAFLLKYYGTANGQSLRDPMHTVTALERFGLVQVAGEPWAIADIGLRMLVPRELFRAQGFPDGYVIDRGHDGRAFSIKAQVKLCGNSVPPHFAAALAGANCPELALGAAGRVA